jgi:arylsulfatase B
MYFASQNCHLPNQVPKEYEDKYYYIQDPDRRKYLGMVTLLDEAIGNITKKLDDLNMLNDTMIFFTSDNGGAVYSSGRNYPLRGGKMTAFEGGHRVRAFINGPGLKPYVNEGMFHSVDWLPTVINAALDIPVGKFLTKFKKTFIDFLINSNPFSIFFNKM